MNNIYNKENVDELFELAKFLSAMEFTERKDTVEFRNWASKISSVEAVDLVVLISLLETVEKNNKSRALKALREGAISQAAYKNAILISDTMKKLDRTATLLTYVSIVLSIVGSLAAVIQLVQ